MYILTSNGERIGLCSGPRYIKVNPNSGCFVQTQESDAQGIAFNSEAYNLPGHTEIMRDVFVLTPGGEEGEGTVERQVAPEIEIERADEYQFINGMADKNVSQDDEITNNELALCEVYEMLLG